MRAWPGSLRAARDGVPAARTPYVEGVPAVRRLRLAALLLPLLLVTACTGDDSAAPKPTPSAPPTPLESLSTTDLVVPREAFCPMVPPDAVTAALGSEPASSTSYDNGQRAAVASGVKDVAHEFACTWRAHDGTTARAWVFAPPITRSRAGSLVRSATASGCAAVKGPDFGSPSVATRCVHPGRFELGYRGLFGDAWLTCTLSAPGKKQPADLTQRANRWCAAVAGAAAS